MLRLLLLAVMLVAAVVAVEVQWNKADRSLTLRLREEDEMISLVRDRALRLGEKAITAAGEAAGLKVRREQTAEAPAPVGAPDAEVFDRLTREDREALDRLIEEKIREKTRGAPAGAH